MAGKLRTFPGPASHCASWLAAWAEVSFVLQVAAPGELVTANRLRKAAASASGTSMNVALIRICGGALAAGLIGSAERHW